MGRRFEELEEVYNTLAAIDFDFSTLPANNKYRKYQEWKQDPELRKRDSASKTATGRKAFVGLKAFGLPSTDGEDEVKIKVGRRVIDQINALDSQLSTPLELTLDNIPDTFTQLNGYQPAKVVAGLRSASATTPKSKITGIEYKKTIQESYTIPFGKGAAANASEFSQQSRIVDAFNENYSVTFTPERLRRS